MPTTTKTVLPAAPGFFVLMCARDPAAPSGLSPYWREPVVGWLVETYTNRNGPDSYDCWPIVCGDYEVRAQPVLYPDGRVVDEDTWYDSADKWYAAHKEELAREMPPRNRD